MTIDQLPDDFTPQQFMQLDRAGLDSVPYELKKWECQCKGCTNGTKVRDYGISPWYFLHRNSRYSYAHPEEYWEDLSTYIWTCSKHRKLTDRLKKRFTWVHIYHRLMADVSPLQKVLPLK